MRLRWLLVALSAVFAILTTWSLARAQDAKAPAGDASEGAAMHARDCVACHVRRVGGDGSAMYTRAERRVTSLAKLKAQVAACNTELGTNYFPDDEEHVTAYLNLRYYGFRP
jgi:mono/diheme cytochrome c family protein